MRRESGSINVDFAININDLDIDNFYDNIIMIDDYNHGFDIKLKLLIIQLKDYMSIRINTDLDDIKLFLLKIAAKTFATW